MRTIIATACNSGKYFRLATMLIASIHKHSYDIVDEIKVLDLGLTNDEINTLISYDKVNVIAFDSSITNKFFREYWDLKKFGWKVYFIYSLSRIYRNNNLVWVDAGVCFINNFQEVIDLINIDHIFATSVGKFTVADECIKKMNCTNIELIKSGLQAGFIGWRAGGGKQYIIDEWYRYSTYPECLLDYGNRDHRWDQSILSVLFNRYEVLLQDERHFLYWYGGDDITTPHYHIDPIYGTGYPEDCISIAHRGTYLTEYNKLKKYIKKIPVC